MISIKIQNLKHCKDVYLKKDSEITACTPLDVVSIKILLIEYIFIHIFFDKYCPYSDGKSTIKLPAKTKFCRNSIRISAIIEIRQRCPNCSRIWTLAKFRWRNSYCRNSILPALEPGGSSYYPRSEPEPRIRFRFRLAKSKKNGSSYGSLKFCWEPCNW